MDSPPPRGLAMTSCGFGSVCRPESDRKPHAGGVGRGVIRSPNAWDHPDVYDVENAAIDPDGVIESALLAVTGLDGTDLLDIGCGTGYHLGRFVELGARVVGLEPHAGLARRARDRSALVARVVRASAEAIPLPDDSVDVIHARWAYFFGAGSEPGIAEVARVLRPGGVAHVIDHDATRSTFGGWFRRAYPAYDPAGVARFWRRWGFTRVPLDVRWVFSDRVDLEDVVRIEFPPAIADRVLAEHPGLEVDHALNLWWRRFRAPTRLAGPLGPVAAGPGPASRR